MRVLFVGDGPRDAATIPRLVEQIIGCDIEEKPRAWRELRVNGYERKVMLVLREARDKGCEGVLAVVDRDTADRGVRLKKLRAGRDRDREKCQPMPTAIGEANPNGDAWLLDDQVAIRTVLKIDESVHIPTVRKTDDPKKTLDALIAESERSSEKTIEVFADIAQAVVLKRCVHAQETGFKAFEADVRHEFKECIKVPRPKPSE